ncbi:hypothetical protein SAY86_001895 [Trapa natans]|uniref:Uncharacterized protein n=1 Tax=Trapa natans TaxID=22666 RepID=A0AAN7R2T1_TRANT|nr:hypothetical protein SAY86_001895 [Trapa natans]
MTCNGAGTAIVILEDIVHCNSYCGIQSVAKSSKMIPGKTVSYFMFAVNLDKHLPVNKWVIPACQSGPPGKTVSYFMFAVNLDKHLPINKWVMPAC